MLASIPVEYYVNLGTCRKDRENVPAFSKYSYFRYPAPSVRMEVDAASTERVAILDAGAQYGKVIDRRVRELNVESVLLPLDTAAYTLKEAVSGGREIVGSGRGSSSSSPWSCLHPPV